MTTGKTEKRSNTTKEKEATLHTYTHTRLHLQGTKK